MKPRRKENSHREDRSAAGGHSRYLEKKVIVRDNPQTNEVLRDVVRDAHDRLIAPAIERDPSNLTERAEDGAIRGFERTCEQL